MFPPPVQGDLDLLLDAMTRAPKGLRSMAAIYELDVSMSLDDLAWHFLNHNDDRVLDETELGLQELEAAEPAEVFHAAREIVMPFLSEIRGKNWGNDNADEYLERTGIQAKIDPLNERIWENCKLQGNLGLLQYWVS